MAATNDTECESDSSEYDILPFARLAPDEVIPYGDSHEQAPYVRSSSWTMERAGSLASVRPDELVCDLGCGEGEALLALCAATGCRGLGVDMVPSLLETARERLATMALPGGKRPDVVFEQGDCFEPHRWVDDADVLFLYLTPPMMKRPALHALVRRAIQRGCRVVVHRFFFPDDWAPVAEDGPARLRLYTSAP